MSTLPVDNPGIASVPVSSVGDVARLINSGKEQAKYARMIVLLHKEIGVKFFVASHSTDMISAIRYIAAKEEVQDKLNFYLAEDSEGTPYEYTYRDLGLDIDPIFKSFNKSLDKIDEYGVCE